MPKIINGVIHTADCTCDGPEKVYICAGCQRTVGWCYGAADRNFDYCDGCAVVRTILEEERQRVFTCFKCGVLDNSDGFTALDWETPEGEERFIYVYHGCLAKYG